MEKILNKIWNERVLFRKKRYKQNIIFQENLLKKKIKQNRIKKIKNLLDKSLDDTIFIYKEFYRTVTITSMDAILNKQKKDEEQKLNRLRKIKIDRLNNLI